MDLKPLERSFSEYEWVLETWLKVPGLNIHEATMIRTFQESLKKSLGDFDQLRRIALSPQFFPVLKSAAAKAVAAGVLINWSEFPHHDQAA